MKLRWWLLWLFASFLAGLGFLACALGLIAEPARADAPLIWGASNTAQMLNSGGLVAKDGSVYPKFTEKNYLAAGAWSIGAAASPTWVASGAGITCSNATTNLPDASASPTALAVTGASGSTAFCYADFTLDISDYNKKLKLAFDQATVTYTASDFRIDVYSCSVAFGAGGACSGTLTRLPLSTDIPTTAGICTAGTSCLPALSGTYRTTFDAPGAASKFIQVQIGLNATSTDQLNLAQIVVGPGVSVQGAAVTDWQSYTPSYSNSTNVVTDTANWRRVGSSMQLKVRLHFSGAGAGSTFTASLPSGYTINTSVVSSSTSPTNSMVGYGSVKGVNIYSVHVSYFSSTTLFFGRSTATSFSYAGTDFVTNDQVEFDITVPVNEWAGSGTVNLAQNDVEYVSNSSAADADDTASFAYGPNGSPIPSLTAARQRVVSFTSPVSVTDQITLEISKDGSRWVPLMATDQFYGLSPLSYQGTYFYGLGIDSPNVTATTAKIWFGTTPSTGTAYGSGTGATTWATINGQGWRWRVKKVRGGQAVGFGIVQPGVSAGLVSASGVPGNTTGSAAPSGYVANTITQTSPGTGISSSGVSTNIIGPYTVPAGVWMVTGNVYASLSAAGTLTGVACGLSTTSGGFDNLAYATMLSSGFATTAADFDVGTPPRVIVSSGSTSLYLVGRLTYTGTYTGNWTSTSSFTLTRIY